jgi:hypothetical protein
MIPYANHNQSPRNQLSCSQSKQGVSVYSTAFQNRFDNQVHVLCYGQAPLVRTLYYDYLADGQMGYGQNIILAMGSFTGYNQDDGILFNADSFARGMFRSTFYRSYEAFEEDDPMTHGKTRIGNPAAVPGWLQLKPGIDYSKLDERGIVRVGEYVDENSVLVGMYLQSESGDMRDASVTAQVWTRGRVEEVSVTVNNSGLAMVKVRVVQERVPELGDKFCLTPEHEVFTRGGWIPINRLVPGTAVLQLDTETQQKEFVVPSELMSFEHTGAMYAFSDVERKIHLVTTPEHRMYVESSTGVRKRIFAKHLYTSNEEAYFVSYTGARGPLIQAKKRYERNPSPGGVHCVTVPSGVFLVRHKWYPSHAVWTGNSNRHGQKGTIGMLLRGYDMPRTSEGIPVDMIMNPHAIPSRMTVAQMIEALVGKAAPPLGTVGNGTLFMNDGNPVEAIGGVLRDVLGMEPFGEELMYDGMSGQLIPTQMFIGNVYTMRLKHMPEDKWNARGEGRREQRTHQPTGGRGAQGGLRIGEMERDAILGHGISGFLQESIMKRADGYSTIVCNGCGTIPIYNERQGLNICPSCDGPVKYIGSTATNLDILPPLKRSVATFSKINIPYAFKLLEQEMNAYLNMGMRVLTGKDVTHFGGSPVGEITADEEARLLSTVLPEKILLDIKVPTMIVPEEQPEVGPENLAALGITKEEEEEKDGLVEAPVAVSNQNSVNIQLPVGMNVAQQVAPEGIEIDDIPLSSEAPLTLQQQQPQFQQQQPQFQQQQQQQQQQVQPQFQQQQVQPQFQQGGGGGNSVNVQTTNQPVLVIPMNVEQAAPTEVFQSPMRGAPNTIAVDTSDRALNSMGLPSQQRVTRGVSPNARRPSSGGARSGGGPTVTVQRQGSSPPSNSNSNVKVQVTKQG